MTTERTTALRGRRARWSGAALVAPLAAVVFGGSTAFALQHDPHPAPAPAAPSAPQPDAALVALRQGLQATAAQLADLRGQVASLRARAAKLRAGSASTAAAGPSGSSGSSAPIVITLPAPATHTTTGGS